METIKKPLFTIPRIYDAGGDITKTWRVDYYFTHPITGEKKRFLAPRENANLIKDGNKRLAYLEQIRLKMLDRLQNGFCPFKDVHLDHLPNFAKYTTIINALDAVLAHKTTFVSKQTTLPVYKCRQGIFKDWLNANRLGAARPNEIKSEHIFAFLSYLVIKRGNSARSRNNYLVDITSMFETMKQINKDWITDNPCMHITKLPTISYTHKPYTDEQFAEIATYLWEHDRTMYYFLRCQIYFSLRPIEVCKLQVKDFNLDNNTITIEGHKTKQRVRKTKRIFSVHKQDFIDLNINNLPPDYYLFTGNNGLPGATPTTRDYFTARFKPIKKHLNLEEKQTMYALRHTFIIDLVKNAKAYDLNTKEIMAISGHTSLQAFQNYIQKYLDEPINDISKKFKLKF
jgi:integrase